LETELTARLLKDDLPLMNNISTDEITPAGSVFITTKRWGQYVYVGMRDGAVKKDEVKNGGFAVVVSGSIKRLRLVARNRALRRKVGWDSTGNRQKHREDLWTELTEHWFADFDRLWID